MSSIAERQTIVFVDELCITMSILNDLITPDVNIKFPTVNGTPFLKEFYKSASLKTNKTNVSVAISNDGLLCYQT